MDLDYLGKNLPLAHIFLTSIVIYYIKKYTFWWRNNVAGPMPIFPFGNLLSRFLWPMIELDRYWIARYGKVYGRYIGTRADLVVADVELLRKITIKDFHLFTNVNLDSNSSRLQQNALLFQKDDQWRNMRTIISPTFSGAKLRLMTSAFNDSTKVLINTIKQRIQETKSGQCVIDSKELFGLHSMTCTLGAFFSIKTESSTEHEPGQAKTKAVQEFAKTTLEPFNSISFFRAFVSMILPAPIQRLIGFNLMRNTEFFFEKSKQIIEGRRNDPNRERYYDYLNLLLNATGESAAFSVDSLTKHYVDGEQIDYATNKDTKNSRLTDDQVVSQVLIFMLLGTNTTTSLLRNVFYVLSHNQQVQSKLRKEVIEKSSSTNANINTYDFISSCEYLDCVISETLRFMPPIHEMDRVASVDYQLPAPYNFTIPRGTVVKIPYHCIHKDSDYWSNPETFDPERFNHENKHKIVPGSFVPFGIGPRFCVGFRFAITLAKICVVNLISQFEVLPKPGSTYPAETEKIAVIGIRYKIPEIIFRSLANQSDHHHDSS